MEILPRLSLEKWTGVASQGKIGGNEIFNRRVHWVPSDPRYHWSQNHSGYHQCLCEKHLKWKPNSSLISENLINPAQHCSAILNLWPPNLTRISTLQLCQTCTSFHRHITHAFLSNSCKLFFLLLCEKIEVLKQGKFTFHLNYLQVISVGVHLLLILCCISS